MPNFKQFIKGFEEPETEPKAEPKPQEVKTEKPKVEESEFSKSRPAFTYDFAESLRKDALNWANEKLPHDKSLPKILNNYTRDEVIDFMRGNIGEDEIMKRAKERNGINQDRVNLLAKQETPKSQPKPGSFQSMEKSFDEPQVKEEEQEIDADWERSYGPMRFDDWKDVNQLKAMFAKANNGGATETAENALERLEELGAVTPGTFDRFVSGEKIDINAKPKPSGTEVFNNLKNYVDGLSQDERDMLLDLLQYPRRK